MSYCGQCGADLQEGRAFCTKCGAKVAAAPESVPNVLSGAEGVPAQATVAAPALAQPVWQARLLALTPAIIAAVVAALVSVAALVAVTYVGLFILANSVDSKQLEARAVQSALQALMNMPGLIIRSACNWHLCLLGIPVTQTTSGEEFSATVSVAAPLLTWLIIPLASIYWSAKQATTWMTLRRLRDVALYAAVFACSYAVMQVVLRHFCAVDLGEVCRNLIQVSPVPIPREAFRNISETIVVPGSRCLVVGFVWAWLLGSAGILRGQPNLASAAREHPRWGRPYCRCLAGLRSTRDLWWAGFVVAVVVGAVAWAKLAGDLPPSAPVGSLLLAAACFCPPPATAAVVLMHLGTVSGRVVFPDGTGIAELGLLGGFHASATASRAIDAAIPAYLILLVLVPLALAVVAGRRNALEIAASDAPPRIGQEALWHGVTAAGGVMALVWLCIVALKFTYSGDPKGSQEGELLVSAPLLGTGVRVLLFAFIGHLVGGLHAHNWDPSAIFAQPLSDESLAAARKRLQACLVSAAVLAVALVVWKLSEAQLVALQQAILAEPPITVGLLVKLLSASVAIAAGVVIVLNWASLLALAKGWSPARSRAVEAAGAMFVTALSLSLLTPLSGGLFILAKLAALGAAGVNLALALQACGVRGLVPLGGRCPACTATVDDGAAFCGGCGQPLAASAAPYQLAIANQYLVIAGPAILVALAVGYCGFAMTKAQLNRVPAPPGKTQDSGSAAKSSPETKALETRQVMAKVPTVVGLSTSDAESAVRNANLQPALGQSRSSDKPSGTIAAVDPPVGTELVPVAKVTLYPSSGPMGQLPPANDPAGVVKRYHAAITRKEWGAAFDCLTAEFQSREGGLDRWKQGYGDTILTEAVNLNIQADGNGGTVRAEVRFRNEGDPPNSHQSFPVIYHVTRQGSQWLIASTERG